MPPRNPSVTLLRVRRDNGDVMKTTIVHGAYGVLVLVVAAVSAGVSFGDGIKFERYGIILERRPFGAEALPVVEAPPIPPVPPEQSVINQIRMSAVVRDEAGGLRVGLVDIKSKRNYMMGVGETVEGVEVVSADYAAERARLRRGPEDYWVSMQGGSNRFERVVPEPATNTARQEVSTGKAGELLPEGMDQKRSYILRRQQREEARLRKELERLSALEAERAKAAAVAATADGTVATSVTVRASRGGKGGDSANRALVKSLMETENIELTDQEVARMLQEYQKELIRKGQTPLPIPLTPETDRQLVEEGLLPAQQ